jgi:hypothetical protein
MSSVMATHEGDAIYEPGTRGPQAADARIGADGPRHDPDAATALPRRR